MKQNSARQSIVAGYEGGESMPLGAFSVLMGLYGAAFGGFLLTASRTGRKLAKIGISDLLLLGVATHKVSRLLTKDWVTAPLRAPFTRYEGSTGAGEVNENARGSGMQRALGELFT
jgi:hypothetical protein